MYLKCDVSEEPELVFEYRPKSSLFRKGLLACVASGIMSVLLKFLAAEPWSKKGSGDTQREPLKRRDRQEPQYGS